MDQGVWYACLWIMQIHIHHERQDKAIFRGGLQFINNFFSGSNFSISIYSNFQLIENTIPYLYNS